MDKIKDKILKITKNIFFKYTLLFGIIAVFLIITYRQYGKTFIWVTDGLRMHLVNLRYLRELLINFIKTGNLSTFTWYIGAGMDLFSNWAYYITGDLFSYLSVLVRTKDVATMYSILVILRLYCVGITFYVMLNIEK